MTVFKAISLFIYSVLFGYFTNYVLHSVDGVPIFGNDYFTYLALVVTPFAVLVSSNRVIAAKNWEELDQRKPVTREFMIEAGLICGFAMAAYPLLRFCGIERELAASAIILATGGLYLIWLNHSLRKAENKLI